MRVDTGDIILNGALIIFMAGVLWSLTRAHTANGTSYYKKFNLIDLICSRDGRVDRPAFLEIGTWFLMAWGFVVLVNKQQWGMLVGYGGLMTGVFVTRAAHSAWLKTKEDQNAGVAANQAAQTAAAEARP